jgi:hypothetical protein
MLARYSDSISPRTRIEITVRKGVGASLKDASCPASIFWHFAADTLAPVPSGVSAWVPDDAVGWEAKAVDTEPTFDMFLNRLDSSEEIDRLAMLACRFGERGIALAVSRFEARCRSSLQSLDAVRPLSD